MSVNGVSVTSYAFERRVEHQEASDVNDEAAQLQATEESNPETSSLLAGDIGAQVAALAILSAQKQRQSNRDIQVAEEAALERAEAAQTVAMHQKADDIRMAGLIDGASGIGRGLFTIAAADANAVSAKGNYEGAATISESLGKGLGSLPKAAQADDDANAETHEHEAAHRRRNLDATRDAIREGQDLLERALDFYKQNQQGVGDAAQTSVKRG